MRMLLGEDGEVCLLRGWVSLQAYNWEAEAGKYFSAV